MRQFRPWMVGGSNDRIGKHRMLMAKDGNKSKLIVMTTTAGLAVAFNASNAEAGAQFKSFQTHSHVVVSVDPEVTYSVEPVRVNGKLTGLKLILDNVREDLGDLSGINDLRTDKVMVVKQPSTGGKRVVYHFMLTEKARSAGIEYFDFRNKAPAEITLDYWMKAGAAPAAAAAKPAAKAPVAKAATKKALPASAQVSTFPGCGQPLVQSADGYINFKANHRDFNYGEFFSLATPDAEYAYSKASPEKNERLGDKAKETAHYRLAVKLYKEGKYALVLRTMEFFHAKYPSSEFNNELRFLKANTLIQLSAALKTDRYLEQGLELLRQVILEEPDTTRGRAALAFTVQKQLEKRTPILALELTLMGAEHKPESYKNPLMPTVYRMASAEALYALGEYERAERIYQTIADENNKLSAEAAFRIGELMVARKQYERAVISYEQSIRKFGAQAQRFPSAFFNLAESYFRMANYAEAEKAFGEFERRFPNDEITWAARIRLAELEQMKIKTADPKKHAEIAALYENIVNRHPYSPGAMMAELRLARCYKGLAANDRLREFFTNFFALRELKKLEDPMIESAEAEQWMDLAEAAFFYNNGDPRAALKRADEFRLKAGRITIADTFRQIYSGAIVDLATSLAKAGRSKELLAAAEHYSDYVPKPEPATFALAIASARLDEGDVKGVAEKTLLLEGRLHELSDEDKDRYHLIRARGRRLLGEKHELILGDLNQISDSGKLASVKYDELAQTSVDKGDLRAALAYDRRLIESKNLYAGLSAERKIEAEIRRVETSSRLGLHDEAAKLADASLLKHTVENKFPQHLARLRDLRAQAFYDAGEYPRSVQALDIILSDSPNHPRRTEFEFMRGKALAKLGRESEAFETFRKLAQAAGSDVWKKSAQAELDQLQWESKVSNIIKDKDRRSSQ